jgi:hypothetical protein
MKEGTFRKDWGKSQWKLRYIGNINQVVACKIVELSHRWREDRVPAISQMLVR